jgi:processive 1,2-diacylglycerol beta-glucosyltransferase
VKQVHLLCERFGGELRSSTFIRLLLPLTHPANAAHFRVTQGRSYEPADIVMVERTWEQDLSAAEELVRQARRDGTCLVYSLDDDLILLGKDGPLKSPSMTPEKVRLVELLARECDGVLVSTDRLKERMLFYNNRVFTVPNAIDERLFEQPPECPPGPRPLVMGFMGTSTHDADLLMIADALRRCLHKYAGDLELQLVGGIGDPATLQAFEGLPVRVLRSGDATAYPDFVRWMWMHLHWDFALAPLEDNPFTRCKSDIKFLDYSALGIPGIYSRVASYEASVSNRETGLLVENHPAAWETAIEDIVAQGEARAELGRRARAYVLARRTLRQHAAHWREALAAILAGREGGREQLATTRERLYRRLVERVRQTVWRTVPPDTTVLVAGPGSDALLDLGRRRAWRFPRDAGTLPGGCGRADGTSIVAHLEELRHQGAEYLIVPATTLWWLDYLPEFKRHLERHYQLAAREDACLIFTLHPASGRPALRRQGTAPVAGAGRGQ